MAKEHTSQLLLDFGPDGKKLVPVVTQDARTRDVLILAFVNREAFDETRRSGHAATCMSAARQSSSPRPRVSRRARPTAEAGVPEGSRIADGAAVGEGCYRGE